MNCYEAIIKLKNNNFDELTEIDINILYELGQYHENYYKAKYYYCG